MRYQIGTSVPTFCGVEKPGCSRLSHKQKIACSNHAPATIIARLTKMEAVSDLESEFLGVRLPRWAPN